MSDQENDFIRWVLKEALSENNIPPANEPLTLDKIHEGFLALIEDTSGRIGQKEMVAQLDALRLYFKHIAGNSIANEEVADTAEHMEAIVQSYDGLPAEMAHGTGKSVLDALGAGGYAASEPVTAGIEAPSSSPSVSNSVTISAASAAAVVAAVGALSGFKVKSKI